MGAVNDLTNDILWADSVAAASLAFRRVLAAAGVELYLYGNRKPSLDHPYLDSTYPADWLKLYMGRHYQFIDPVVLESQTSQLPFAWRYVANRDSLTADQRRLFAEAAGFGLADGYSIPFHGPSGCHAILSFAFGSTERMTRVLTAHPNLRMMGTHYHSAMERLLEADQPAQMLSTIERQCLEGANHGHSLWELSAATHRPEQDIASVLRGAREKLGAATTAQAAEKALRMGLIS